MHTYKLSRNSSMNTTRKENRATKTTKSTRVTKIKSAAFERSKRLILQYDKSEKRSTNSLVSRSSCFFLSMSKQNRAVHCIRLDADLHSKKLLLVKKSKQ